MTDYSYYVPMPLADGLRRCHLEAQQHALEALCRAASGEIVTEVLTDSERQTMHAILDGALQRTAAGIAEYDGYKRDVPLVVEETWEL